MLWFAPKIRVIAVTDEADDRAMLRQAAATEHWALQVAGSYEGAAALLRENGAAVVLCNHDARDRDWRAGIDTLHRQSPESPIIVTAEATDDRLWLEVLERGGFDVLTRPFQIRRLLEAVSRGWAEIRK